ncbi:MAG: hypothetical protein NTY12_03630 [Candidatus Falkowbacteria bacterium]|nr:hypothetical protein [Candidatus Falkowbacteria bacterium]
MNEKIKVVIVDNEEGAKAAAIDAAEDSLSAAAGELELKGSGVLEKFKSIFTKEGVVNFSKKIFKHNLFKEKYRQEEIARTKKLIFESGNIYATEQGSQEEHDEAMSAIVDRFVSEYDEMIHTEAGEKKEVLDENNAEEKELKDDITNLIKDYAAGNLNDSTFQEEKIRLFQESSTNKGSVLGKGGMYADNLLIIAKQIKANVEHGQKLEEMDLEFDVIVGKAKAGVRTEANYNKIDRIVDKISSTKIGSLVNETTVAVAVGTAYCIATAVSQRLLRSKLFALGSFGAATLLSGGVAALKESKRLEDERRQHNRDLAQGKKFNKDMAPRRAELEELRYNTELANNLKENLEASLYEADGSLKEMSQEDLNLVLANLAEIEARIRISDTQRIDLISFSNIKKVEQERYDLNLTRAKAKVDLRNTLDKRSDLNLPSGDNFDDSLAKLIGLKTKMFFQDGGGIEEKNRSFKKMKTKKMAIRAGWAVLAGLTIGAGVQEIKSWFDGNLQGITERFFDGKSEGKSATVFEGLRRWIAGGDSPRLNGPIHEEIINGGHFKLPEGASLVAGSGGAYNLMNGDEIVAGDIEFNPDGSLTEEAKIILANNNVIMSENIVSTAVETTTPGTQPEDIINKNPGLFHQVKRALWLDNNTKAFDKNELKLWWGGDSNSGIDSKGNYVFNVKHMMPKGSYHGNQSVNAQELIKSGGLKMIFSLSSETQNTACEVPIDANGNALIDKDSEIGKLLFANEDGKARFLGKYAEVVQSTGQNPDGSEKIRMLATHVGEGFKGTSPEHVVNEVKTVITNLDVPVDAPIDLPIVLPIMPRTPLEKAYNSLPYGYNQKGSSKEDQKLFIKNRSETLIKDPDAQLDHYNEAEAYMSKFSEEYEQEIEELAKQAGPMEKTTKLTICIPAAGHQEGKNIYKSLENYTKQTADPKEYEICILVNRPDKDVEGKEVKPDETLAEIKRFQKNYPNLRIKIIEKVLPFAEAKIGNARKLLSDATLYRNHQRGKAAPDLIMVSNDADNEGIAPEYIKNFIDKFEANNKIDGMLGQLDWDPAAYVKYPAIHIGTRLFQFLNTEGRINTNRMTSSGANFAFRSSIYSAIGGYLKEKVGGEDVAVGQAIVSARGGDDEAVKAIQFAGAKVSRLYTSTRRAIDAWKSGLAPVEQWDKGFSAFDNEIRAFDLDKDKSAYNFEDEKDVARLKKELEYVINRTLDVYERGEQLDKGKDNKYYKKNLRYLGINYKVSDKGDVVIENMSRLVKNLQKYQKMGVKLRDYKSSKISKEEFSKSEPEKKSPKFKFKSTVEKKPEPEIKPALEKKPESTPKPEAKPEPETKPKPEVKPKPEKAPLKKEEVDLSKLTFDKLYEMLSGRADKKEPLILKGWENKRIKLDKERLKLFVDYIDLAKKNSAVFGDRQVDDFLSYEKVKDFSRESKEILKAKDKIDLAKAKYKTSL